MHAHTHTCCTVYVYKVSIAVVGCKLLHEGSCVEGLGLGWAVEKWLDNKVVNHPWVSPLMMEWSVRPCWENRSILRALGTYLASVLSLCVFVSVFPFPSVIS